MTLSPLEVWFLENRQALYALARYICRGDGEADELVGAACVALVRKFDVLEVPQDALGYAFVVMLNHRRGRWRRLRGFRSVELTESAVPVVCPEDLTIEDITLAQEVQRLSEAQRLVLVCRYWLGLSVDETATTLGMRPGTVKSHHARALAALRQAYGCDPPFPQRQPALSMRPPVASQPTDQRDEP